jgi:hypothetical protein
MTPPPSISQLAATLAVLALPASIMAQQPADAPAQARDGEAPRMCFRGRPHPACSSFWIVEAQGEAPIAQTTRTISFSRPPYPFEETALGGKRLEWNLGHMVNLGPRYAAGGVVGFGTHRTSAIAVKLRGRRWLGDHMSVELEGGYLWTDLRSPAASFGLTADARLNIRDQGVLYLRWDGVSLPRNEHPETGYLDPGGFQQGLSIGAGLGSMPALAGTAALGAAMIVVFVDWVLSENSS